MEPAGQAEKPAAARPSSEQADASASLRLVFGDQDIGVEEVAAADGLLPLLLLEADRLWRDAIDTNAVGLSHADPEEAAIRHDGRPVALQGRSVGGGIGMAIGEDPNALAGVRLVADPLAPRSLVALLIDRALDEIEDEGLLRTDLLMRRWLPHIRRPLPAVLAGVATGSLGEMPVGEAPVGEMPVGEENNPQGEAGSS